jgi:hypothetical protein
MHTCVSPRVKSAEPWVRGRRFARDLIGRMSVRPRPSTRRPCHTQRRTQQVKVLDGSPGHLLVRWLLVWWALPHARHQQLVHPFL